VFHAMEVRGIETAKVGASTHPTTTTSGDALKDLGRDAEGDGSTVKTGDDGHRVEVAFALEDDRSAGLGWFEGGNDFPFDAGEVAVTDADAVADGKERVTHAANLGRNCENGLRLRGNIRRLRPKLTGFLPVLAGLSFAWLGLRA